MRAQTAGLGGIVLLLHASVSVAQVNPFIPTVLDDTPISSIQPSVSGASPSGNTTCDFDGDVTNYLECRKEKVSTTTLIAAALGATVGLLILVGLCVFMCHRSRKRRAPRPVQKAAADARAWRQQALADKVEDYLYPEDKRPPVPKNKPKAQGPIYDDSDEDLLQKTVSFTKPGRHQAPTRIIAPPRHPDSPVEMADGRILYPSNPSPAPRHLQEPVSRPPSTYQPGRRASAYQPTHRRPSHDPPEYSSPPPAVPEKSRPKATEHSRATFGAQPKTPGSINDQRTGEIAYTGRPQSQAGTRPLNVRKSSTPSMYGRPRPPPEGPPPALPHPEVPVAPSGPAVPQSATIPIDDPPSPHTSETIQGSQSPPRARQPSPPAQPTAQAPGPDSRQSMMLSYAIPSYYEARQSAYDQSRSRAPSTYIARSRSGSVDVVPELPQSRSAPETVRPIQPVAPVRRPSESPPQFRVAPERSQTSLSRPVSRVQKRSTVGQNPSIDPFTEQDMMPSVPVESKPKQRTKPSQKNEPDEDGQALALRAAQQPAPSRQHSSNSITSATSSQRPLLARDESANATGDEDFVDAVETLDGYAEVEEEARGRTRLEIPVSDSESSSRSSPRRSPSVDRGGLI